jgi:hypothetical protein
MRTGPISVIFPLHFNNSVCISHMADACLAHLIILYLITLKAREE